jgi:hypothetical protein
VAAGGAGAVEKAGVEVRNLVVVVAAGGEAGVAAEAGELTGEEEAAVEIAPRRRGQDRVLGVFGRVAAAAAVVVDVLPWPDLVAVVEAATLRHRADLFNVQAAGECAPEAEVVVWQVGCQVSVGVAAEVAFNREYLAVGKADPIARQQGQVPVLGAVAVEVAMTL